MPHAGEYRGVGSIRLPTLLKANYWEKCVNLLTRWRARGENFAISSRQRLTKRRESIRRFILSTRATRDAFRHFNFRLASRKTY